MDKQALRNYAPKERQALREMMQQRLERLQITAKSQYEAIDQWLQVDGEIIRLNGTIIPNPAPVNSYQGLFNEYQKLGYEELVEELAYIWFNRFIAIRYMEVNQVLPDFVEILGSGNEARDPEILANYQYLLDADKIKLQDVAELSNLLYTDKEAAYRKLFLAASNKLGDVMPFLFEKLNDWTELVFPQTMLAPGGIVDRLVNNTGITASFQEGVEAIGWLYQFYMSEKKQAVGGLKNNAVKKEDLAVVTQLFTPRWIVDYMNENTLGKVYDDQYGAANVEGNWQYYLKHQNSKKLLPQNENLETLTFFDPACGSGHILVAAFDILYQMYTDQGYRRSEISSLILTNNLFGCDIDRRAAQIANFALYMKAIEKDRRFWGKVNPKHINVLEMHDAQDLTDEEWEFITQDAGEKAKLQNLLEQFANAKQFGSLIQPLPVDYQKYIDKIYGMFEQKNNLFVQQLRDGLVTKLLPVLEQAKLLAQQYAIVVTNPPYHNKYNPTLKKFMETNYKDYKSDLYSAFVYRCLELTKDNGYVGMMTPLTWMFISSHQKLREYIINNYSFSSLIQLEYSAFEEATVPICTFVIQKQNQDPVGEYIRLAEMKGDQAQFVRDAIINPSIDYRYQSNSTDFSKIPGSPIAYWASEKVKDVFQSTDYIGSVSYPKKGMFTGNNDKYIRLWTEIEYFKIYFDSMNTEEFFNSEKLYSPINKGGEFRRWYGNQESVIKFDLNSYNEILDNKGHRSPQFYFNEVITWSKITSSKLSCRYTKKGSITNDASMGIYKKTENLQKILGLLNSKTTQYFVSILNMTINYTQQNIAAIPLPLITEMSNRIIENVVTNNINLSKQEWDAYETSWDFVTHPFIQFKQANLAESFVTYADNRQTMFDTVKANEEELNRIFIDAYGLADELTPEVEDKDITIRLADRTKDAKSFLSYFIGCLLGRYSLDIDGLAYAGGEFDASKYQTFKPAVDGMITLTDEQLFADEERDIFMKLKQFLVTIYGEATLEANLLWLAESLSDKVQDPEVILRDYFMKDFIKDHLQTYSKRPIYWLIDSGKQKGMQTLMYLHRYTPLTFHLAVQDHFEPLLKKLRDDLTYNEEEYAKAISKSEQKVLNKAIVTASKRIEELESFQDTLREVANQELEMDLDDGVKVNYQKFADILYKVKM